MSAKPKLPLKAPQAPVLAALAVVIASVAVIGIAGREPSQADDVASDVVLSATAAQDMPRPVTTSRAAPVPTSRTTPASRVENKAPVTQTKASADQRSEVGSQKSEGAPSAAPSTQTAQAITITGCLERDDDTFRLKDTEGEDAPQSRSWKGGFVRRSNRSVDVVDSLNRFKLENHVGERVSATGTLVDGDMQLRSLRRVAASCETEA
jgi:hypothetical protein